MNDDQIRSELERRAAGMSSRPDWARRDLLPAVREAIDAHPQRVTTTALLSPRVGIMAVVAALLVLVVAVPRLAPQPPAATSTPTDSPTPARYSVLSSQEFVAAMSSGSLLGKTVLVDAVIEEGVTVARGGDPPCLPPSPCTWGSLIASPNWAIYARAFAVPAGAGGTPRDGEAWPSWASSPVPVSGVVALSIQPDGLVVFEGLVHPASEGLTWSVTDASALDPADISPGTAVLVRGRLTSVGVDRDCLSVPPPPAGLPIRVRACQSTGAIASTERGDTGILDVQPDALGQFGGSETLFAISPRLYGGYCDGPPPCWMWDVVAVIDQPSSTDPTSPPPTARPELGRTIPCAAAPQTSPFPTVTDETGFIASCTSERRNLTQSFSLRVTNPDGDLMMLEVAWAGATCDGPNRLYLRRAGSAFALAAESDRPLNVTCDSMVYENHLRLALTEPIDATQVTTSFEFAPPTTPAPSAESNTLVCDPPAPVVGDRVVALIDHAGLIESCRTQAVDWPGQPIVVTDVERGVVRVVYADGCAGASEVEIELWARGDLGWPGQPPYVLNVALQTPKGPIGCRAEMVGVALDITFINADLAPLALASEVEALVTFDGWGMAVAETEDGSNRFTLEIAADKQEYIEGEAIEVSSSLTSDADVTLQCASGQHIALEQLDGPIEFYPGPFILMCPGPTELRGGEPTSHDFVPVWGSTEPNPLAAYLLDDALYLPAGTYRFFVVSSFNVGEIGGEGVRLEASTIVRVGPGPDAAPEPSQSTPPDCTGTFMLLLDRTGLVEECSSWTPTPGQSGVTQGTDASSVFVAWTYSYCRGAPYVRFEQDGTRYVFKLGHLINLPAVLPSCEPVTRTVGIAVRFRQPLDMGLIDVVTQP